MSERENLDYLLTRELGELLSRGLVLTSDVTEYLNSTFGPISAEEFSGILEETDDTEKRPLLELIFFPDRELRESIEPSLQKGKFREKDIEVIARYLTEILPRVPVYHPGLQKYSQIPLELEYATNLVSRLYIQKELPAQILGIIENKYSEVFGNYLKVSLRCAKFEQNKLNTDLLERVLAKLDLETISRDMFYFLLGLLKESKPDENLWDFFVRKQFFLKQHLEKAQQIEYQMRVYPMEVLMPSHSNTLSISSETLRDQSHMLDKICLYIFGEIPTPGDVLPLEMDKGNRDLDWEQFLR